MNFDMSGKSSSVFTTQVLVESLSKYIRWVCTAEIMEKKIKVKDKDLGVTDRSS